MERTELINKINDYDYMRKLIMENFTADNYKKYCSELANLMNEVQKYSTKAEIYGRVPLKKEDYKLFLDGTIARLFKESITRKDILQGNETNKLSQMALLPEPIAVLLFGQDDMKEVLSYSDAVAVHHLISTGGSSLGTMVSSQLLIKARELEPKIEEAEYENKRLERELAEAKKKRRESNPDDLDYDRIRLETVNLRKEFEDQNQILYELNLKRAKMIEIAHTTIAHAKELYDSQEKKSSMSVEPKSEPIIEVDGVIVKKPKENVTRTLQLLDEKKQKEKTLNQEYDIKGNITRELRKYEISLKNGKQEDIEKSNKGIESSKKLIAIQNKKIEELRKESVRLVKRATELLEYSKIYLLEENKEKINEQEQTQKTSIEDVKSYSVNESPIELMDDVEQEEIPNLELAVEEWAKQYGFSNSQELIPRDITDEDVKSYSVNESPIELMDDVEQEEISNLELAVEEWAKQYGFSNSQELIPRDITEIEESGLRR